MALQIRSTIVHHHGGNFGGTAEFAARQFRLTDPLVFCQAQHFFTHRICAATIGNNMNRIEAITKLQDHAQAIRAMGATSLYLFGSTAREEAHAISDLDLFIDYDPNGKFNAFDLVGIKQYLEDELRVPVDVTTRDGLHPMLRSEIEQTAVRVF